MHAHINFKFYNECNHINTNTLENIIIYHLMIYNNIGYYIGICSNRFLFQLLYENEEKIIFSITIFQFLIFISIQYRNYYYENFNYISILVI